MKPTTYWSWSLKNLHGRGRHVMRGKYTEEAAHQMFKGQDPQKVLGSEEIRNCPETPEEAMGDQFGTGLAAWRRQQAGIVAPQAGASGRPSPR